MAKFAGNYTRVPVNLTQGLYIVHAGNQSAKLLVSANGTGNTTAQPATTETQIATYTPAPPETNLRAAAIKIYWNITAGSSTMPVEIPNVEKFHFTPDNSIVFTLKNGNTIELTDYKGVEFAVEPSKPAVSDWDIEKTLKFGGASYMNLAPSYIYDCIVVVHNKGLIIWDRRSLAETKYPKENIASNIWTEFPNGRLSYCTDFGAGMTYITAANGGNIRQVSLSTGQLLFSSLSSNWSFNGNTNIIPSTIIQNADGTLTVKYTWLSGFPGEATWEYTFKGW